jgi:hypothetical protein
VQQTLANPRLDKELRVYAIWFNMYSGDARQRWRDTLLTDARVRHYWDEQRAVGRQYLQTLPMIWPKRSAETVLPDADALWDAYLLYGRDAHWGDQPPEIVSWGSPILRTTETLARDLERMVNH